MRAGGKTVVIPGPGGVVILPSDLGVAPSSLFLPIGTTADDTTFDPPPAAPPDTEVIIIAAPGLGQPQSPTAGQGTHPFRPVESYADGLRRPKQPASAMMATAAPPVAAPTPMASQAEGQRAIPWYARAWSAIASAFRSFLSIFRPPPPSPDPHWDRIRESVQQEIAHLRSLPGKPEQQAYLRNAGTGIMTRIQAHHGTSRVGFHYNLHGGHAEGYLKTGGIVAQRGDIRLDFPNPPPDALHHKVYFFDASETNLFDILDESHPMMLFFPSRMGHVLIPFRLDSPYFQQALAEGGAFDQTEISISFREDWARAHNGGRMIGIPASTFLAPPLTVFIGVAKRLGMRLSRDEETLAVMRYIEAMATHDSP